MSPTPFRLVNNGTECTSPMSESTDAPCILAFIVLPKSHHKIIPKLRFFDTKSSPKSDPSSNVSSTLKFWAFQFQNSSTEASQQFHIFFIFGSFSALRLISAHTYIQDHRQVNPDRIWSRTWPPKQPPRRLFSMFSRPTSTHQA